MLALVKLKSLFAFGRLNYKLKLISLLSTAILKCIVGLVFSSVIQNNTCELLNCAYNTINVCTPFYSEQQSIFLLKTCNN